MMTFTAPGRVNLIGEHTDYTGGLVFPLAIPFQTEVRIYPADDGRYTFASTMFESVRAMDADDRGGAQDDWSDYPVGVLRELQKLGIEPPPFCMEISGNVPLGAGLSSSASIEVATAMALLNHSGRSLSIPQIALLCQRAENLYVGSPCGIMDQFVITAAVAGHALMLQTRTLDYAQYPLNAGALAGCVIAVVNSMVKHTVTAGSDYAQRRKELEAGQAVVCERFGLRDLGEATIDQLQQCEGAMSADSYKRCRHVVTENARVREAAKAMEAGNPAELGTIMTAAHASERDDFECSVAEVDFLVATAVTLPGCYGARLTGGGFGGCTVNLVEATQADAFLDSLRRAYREQFGIDAEAYLCSAVDGAVARAAQQESAA